MSHTLLAVFAHPDDEFSVGPLLARCAAEGHGVYLASITSGQKASATHSGIPRGEALGAAREEELRCAAAALGIHEPILLGFQDQGISTQHAADAVAGCLREIIERLRPEVLLTFGADGITGHPDHRAASYIVTEVFQEHRRLGWKPRKLYYTAFPDSLLASIPPPFDARLRTTADEFVTTVVDCRAWLDAAASAVRCHRTQWTPERMLQFEALNRDVLRGRVHLRLAMSAARESHVFDGLS
jgi:LmbE family N-acetylglucosaminyl deacetylase